MVQDFFGGVMLDFDFGRMLFRISPEEHEEDILKKTLRNHPEVEFVSYVGLDMAGNDTDERIPVDAFVRDMENMLKNGVQTDGSAVHLPKIAALNNAKVDMIPDTSVNWYVDYNFDNVSNKTGLPVGTLRIPAFLIHNEKSAVGSRSILRDSEETFKKDLMSLLKASPYVFKYIDGIKKASEIEEIITTSATELEFWVMTPEDKADKEQLSTSQELKEQYWKRTYGPVRTALEKSIEILNYYGFEVEMGHKEVGGVKSKLTRSGNHDHIMEQLEIDWKYNVAMQTADNEKQVKYIIRDVFNQFGLLTTFNAKPVEGVAGSGEHTHLGVAAKLKNGKIVNLFAPAKPTEEFLSPIGFGGVMGVLKNYEAIRPFTCQSIDSLKRLKPGYEAPVCIVTSLGHSPKEPSRNRTVLLGLIRDLNNPMATRFELRAPNPKTNTYLVLAACYMAMLDGINAVLKNEKTPAELEKSISKKYGDDDFYLEKDREYRSELDVFDDYTEEERTKLFGSAPRTVWETLKDLDSYPDKVKHIIREGAFPEIAVESFKEFALNQWAMELHNREIPNSMAAIRNFKKLHGEDGNDFDEKNWEEIENLKVEIAKSSLDRKCLLTLAKEALDEGDFERASDLEIEIDSKMTRLKDLYSKYRKNLF